MKKNYIVKIAALFSAATVFASCTEELALQWERVDKESGVSYHEVQILASNPAEEVKPETKAYIESDGAGGYISKWDEGDQIALIQWNSVDTYRTKVSSKKADLTLTESDKTASFAVTLAEVAGASNYKYWAGYPENAVSRTSDDLTFAIPETQTFTANMFDKAADVMISQPVERAEYSSEALKMGFARIGTVAKMTLKGLTAGETLKSVTFSTTENAKYLAGTVKYDLVNNVLKSGITLGKQTLTLTAGESIVVPVSGQVDVWFRTAEVTLSDNFTVVVYTRDDGLQNYSYTKSVNLASAGKTLAFNSGRMTTFGVTGLNSGKVTLDYEPLIAEGYYVLHVTDTEQGDKVIANTCAGSNFLDAVTNPLSLDANSKYNASSTPELIWRLVFDEDNNKYAFFSPDSQKYMSGNLSAGSSSEVWFYMGANSGAQTGTFTIYDGAAFASASHIGYNYNNGTNPRFKFYSDAKYPGNLTFTPAYSAPVVAYSNVALSNSYDAVGTIEPTNFIFASSAALDNVYSNSECTITTNWVTATVNSTTGVISYSAEENDTTDPRTAYIKIIATGEGGLESEAVLSISQLGAGSAIDYSTLQTSNVTLTTTGGANASEATANTYDAIKAGTSSKAGVVKITVPAGTTNLHVHIAGWKDQSVTVGVTGATVTPSSLSPISDSGVSGSEPDYTITDNSISAYYTNLALSGIDTETTLTFTATAGNRFVIWGVNSEIDNRASAGIEWQKSGVKATEDVGTLLTGADTAPTAILANPNGVSVSYTSSDTSVATIDPSTGAVSLIAEGSTDITATFAGSKEYKPATATYTLNVSDGRDKLSTPSFSVAAGAVAANTTVTISGPSGSTIYYTVDGSTPTSESAHGTIDAGTASVSIDVAKTVNAIAVKSDYKDSDVASAVYTILGVATPLNAPENVAISAIDASGFTASWDEVAGAEGYYWTLSTSSTYAGVAPANTLAEDAIDGSSTHSVTESVTLSAGTTYYLYVIAAGDGISTADSEPASTSSSFAGDKTYTITWNSTNNSASVQDYTSSWSVTAGGLTCNMQYFNNNQNGWNYVKCGRKNTASVATIITDSAIPEAIRTVTLTIDALTASKINSIKLYSSSDGSSWTEEGSFTKATGDQSVVIASPTANKYYKIEADCASGSSNGLLTISKLTLATN